MWPCWVMGATAPFTNFNLGNGYNMGQGIYCRPTALQIIHGTALAHLVGTGTNATGAADADANTLMNRWEARALCVDSWIAPWAWGRSAI